MENEAPIRVMLVDDHQVVRAGIALIIETEDGMDVIGEAADGAEAVRQAHELRPDVILMDLQMPVLDGVGATERITNETESKVLMLTTFSDDEQVLACLQAGASGFLLKNSDPGRLVEAIRAAHRGHAALSPEVTASVIQHSVEPRTTQRRIAAPSRDALDLLTDREREVLLHVAAGKSNEEIAGDLFLGASTIKSHVSACLSKLHLRDRVQLVVFAFESGFAESGEQDAGPSN